jgi:hypothetical protein
VVDERRTGQSFESAFGPVPAAPLAALAAGLFLLGGVAQLSRGEADTPARRRRRFGVLAVLICVAVFFLRRALAEPPAEAEADADVDDSTPFVAELVEQPTVAEELEPTEVPDEPAVIQAAAPEAEVEGDASDKEGLVARVDMYSRPQPVEAQ